MADESEITDRDIELARLKDAALDFLDAQGTYEKTKGGLLRLMASMNEPEVMVGNVVIRKDKYCQLSIMGSEDEED